MIYFQNIISQVSLKLISQEDFNVKRKIRISVHDTQNQLFVVKSH